jgi:hypothetical protein
VPPSWRRGAQNRIEGQPTSLEELSAEGERERARGREGGREREKERSFIDNQEVIEGR